MGWIGEMGRRVVGLVKRDSMTRELEEEMRLHREARERELVATGADRDEARYAARRKFGNATAIAERGRDAWGWRWLEDFVGDLKFGARMVRKNPGFTTLSTKKKSAPVEWARSFFCWNFEDGGYRPESAATTVTGFMVSLEAVAVAK
jgi:hypothetical protein